MNKIAVIVIPDTGELELPTKPTIYEATAVKKKAIKIMIIVMIIVTARFSVITK